METGKMKLALSAGALALSMALAGCGGGGSNAVLSPPTPTPAGGGSPATASACEDAGRTWYNDACETAAATQDRLATMQRADIQSAHTAARALVTPIAATDPPTEDQITALKAANTELDTAIKAATALSDEDKEEYQRQLTDLQLIATLAEGVKDGDATANMLQDQVMKLEGDVDDAEGERDTAAQVSGLFATAATQKGHAEDAQKEAEAALKAAKENSEKLAPISVAGDSKKATDNAQAVLDAEGDVAAALAKARKAKTDAEAAQTTANGLAEGTPDLERLKAEIADAIKAADDAIKAIEAIQEDTGRTTLAGYVFDIEGSDGDGTPGDKGEAVAEAIEAAFTADTRRINQETDSGSITAALDRTKATATATMPIVRSDAPDNAMTWAQIVGADKIDQKAFGTANANIPVTSVTGMDISDFLSGDTSLTALPEFTGGSASTNYMGIPGTLYCVGDCSLEGTKLKGELYFSPTTRTQRYTRAPNEENYSAYNLYATYGHWLSVSGGDITIHPFAGLSHGAGALADPVVAGDLTEDSDLPDTATYEGKAVGMSVHSTYDSNQERTNIESGAFTADVSLSARFGTNASLSGTVSNFKSENPGAIDPTWRVSLGGAQDGDAKELGTGSFTDGVTRDTTPGRSGGATGEDRVWTAQTYGLADERPTGIFGGFNAEFSDGHVAGAYATRND